MEFTFGGVKVLFRLYSMTGHVVMVGSTGAIHLLDGFVYVFVGRFQVMPVTNPVGNGDSGNKGQTGSKYGNDNRFSHNFPLQIVSSPARADFVILLNPIATVKEK